MPPKDDLVTVANKDSAVMTIEYLLTKGEFQSSEEFSVFIEKEAKRRKIDHMEAIMEYCDSRNIDPPSVAKSITSSLKQKIQAESEQKNLLKTKSTKLPT